MQELDTTTAPLEGLRVLDFSIMLAGPYCARLLADVGADDLRCEPGPAVDVLHIETDRAEGVDAHAPIPVRAN